MYGCDSAATTGNKQLTTTYERTPDSTFSWSGVLSRPDMGSPRSRSAHFVLSLGSELSHNVLNSPSSDVAADYIDG